MTTHKRILRAAALLILSGPAWLLIAQQTNSLSIAGRTGSARVSQISGHNYVDVEGLVRLVNGSISFNANQIVLTVPGLNPDTPAAPAAPVGFSKEFVTAGIEAMAQQREWRAALRNAIERSYPLNEIGLAALRARAQQALGIASVSTTTAADRNALPFLNNQFNNVSKLSDKYLQLTLSMTYIEPNSLDRDPLDQKITACTRSLASMATVNQFVDDGSCQ